MHNVTYAQQIHILDVTIETFERMSYGGTEGYPSMRPYHSVIDPPRTLGPYSLFVQWGGALLHCLHCPKLDSL